MSALTDRDSLKRALFRLIDTEETDPGLTEHDDTTDEALDYLLTHGLWDAQDFMIRHGMSDRWVTTTQIPLSGNSWNTSSDNPGEYTALPDDVLRVAGDRNDSPLHDPDGRQWGTLIHIEDRHNVRGDAFWFQNEDLWVADAANPPSDLHLDYHHRLPAPSGSTVDFPERARPLIVAYAGERALDESWAPGGRELYSKVNHNLIRQKAKAHKVAKRHMGPNRIRPKKTIGNRYAGWRF